MKKSLSPMTISCALLCLMTVVSCQRSVTTPVPSLQSKIAGKWTMVVAIANGTDFSGNFNDTINYTPADYFDFKADSTLSIMANSIAYNGRWQIDSSRLYITGTQYMDLPAGFDLPVLDQHNLEIHNAESTSGYFLNEKLHLIR